jgi:hypothetical protein
MMELTWGELKRLVDDALNKANMDDATNIQFIDVTPYSDDAVEVNPELFGLEIITYKKDDAPPEEG